MGKMERIKLHVAILYGDADSPFRSDTAVVVFMYPDILQSDMQATATIYMYMYDVPLPENELRASSRPIVAQVPFTLLGCVHGVRL
jgi:hypothetical protein